MKWHSLRCLLLSLSATLVVSQIKKEFCIVGAGPSSIQLGHYFHTAGYDFVTFEMRKTAGNFFRRLPIHRSLISINKRFPKEGDRWRELSKEFRLRHDWNSLLDQDNVTLVGDRTEEIWPEADVVADYLEDFAKAQQHHILFETKVNMISKMANGHFDVKTTRGDYHCQRVIMAAGITKPVKPQWPGADLVTPYDELPLSQISGGGHWADGLRVAVLGSGNAAFEVTKSIEDHAPEVVIFTRQKPKSKRTELRFAYKTHYVGDVRIKVSELVERYQFGSGDGMVQFTTGKYAVFKCYDQLCMVLSEPVTDCAGRENAERLTFDIPAQGSLGASIVKSKTKGGLPAFGTLEANSIADHLGIREGDCIAKINGQDILGKSPKEWGPKPWKTEVLRTGDHWIPTAQGVDKEEAEKYVAKLKAAGLKDDQIRLIEEEPTWAVGRYSKEEDKQRKQRLNIFYSDEAYEQGLKRIVVDVKYSVIKESQDIANLVADIRSETVDDAMRIPFDKIITCYGWKMDKSVFAHDIVPKMDLLDKRPNITHTFESVNVPNLYFLGALMHFVDFRKSAGGFIHGFRYLARLMFRRFQKEKGIAFPHVTMPLSTEELAAGVPTLSNKLLKRWQDASAPYQMFSYIGDGVVFRQENGQWVYDYYEEVGLEMFRKIHKEKGDIFMTWHFRYGDDHHGDGVLVAQIPHSGYFAELSQFLHPVLEFHYPNPDTGKVAQVERHYVREDVPQMYNSTNHRYFLEGYVKTVICDRFLGRRVARSIEDPHETLSKQRLEL